MAKSKIIKDLANGNVDTLTALKRTKVLLSDFDNQEVKTWINNEITGYPSTATLPDYRVTMGNLVGSYFKGSMASHMTWKNVSIPLGKMPDDIRDKLLSVPFTQGVDALKQLSEDKSGTLGNRAPLRRAAAGERAQGACAQGRPARRHGQSRRRSVRPEAP